MTLPKRCDRANGVDAPLLTLPAMTKPSAAPVDESACRGSSGGGAAATAFPVAGVRSAAEFGVADAAAAAGARAPVAARCESAAGAGAGVVGRPGAGAADGGGNAGAATVSLAISAAGSMVSSH